jgi:plasmid stability protein
MQYTIRNVPAAVDAAIRRRASTTGASLNQAANDALAEGVGVVGCERQRRDLSDIAGSWKPDRAIESALAAQDVVDEAIWR